MGKPTEGNIKGAQEHAEGQHGKQSLDRLQEINAPGRAAGRDESAPEQGEDAGRAPGRLTADDRDP